jgi:hypothetical protein
LLIQVQGKRRRVILIVGNTDDDTELEYVDGTGGDFEIAVVDDDEIEDDGESEEFGFRPQRRTSG